MNWTNETEQLSRTRIAANEQRLRELNGDRGYWRAVWRQHGPEITGMVGMAVLGAATGLVFAVAGSVTW